MHHVLGNNTGYMPLFFFLQMQCDPSKTLIEMESNTVVMFVNKNDDYYDVLINFPNGKHNDQG